MMRMLSLLFFVSFSVFAEDAGHTLSGQTIEGSIEQDLQQYQVEDSPLFGSDEIEEMDSNDKKNPFLFGSKKDLPEELTSEVGDDGIGFTTPGTYQKTDQLVEYKLDDLIGEFQGKSSYAFSLTYIQDSFTYDDGTGAFERTFNSGDSSDIKGGFVLFSLDKYFSRHSWINFAWGMNFGFGFNSGRGTFVSDGTKSDTVFKLWTIPLDLGVSGEIPVGSWAKINLGAGPSALGLIQRRDDREDNDPDRVRRQIGFGFFGEAKLQISLSHFLPEESLRMYQNYKATNMLFNIETRLHNYSNFADNLTISGASIGAGFTFEFL